LYIVNPIISMIKSIESFLQTGEPTRVSIDTRDELHDLATSIANLTTRVSSSK
jgi:hypothetical protein